MKLGETRGTLRSLVDIRERYGPGVLRKRAWQEGVLGGQRRWLVVGGFVWTGALIRWAWRRDQKVVYRTTLKAGEELTITTSKPGKNGRAA